MVWGGWGGCYVLGWLLCCKLLRGCVCFTFRADLYVCFSVGVGVCCGSFVGVGGGFGVVATFVVCVLLSFLGLGFLVCLVG